MEAVLHVEPIIRQTRAPLSIGHTDDVFYGEGAVDGDDHVGDAAARILLGCPLETNDVGSTRSTVPLVKTFECTPDFSRDRGHIYSETIHYLLDRRYLIPFRSKIRSGLGQGLRITHLPSLNAAREHITGFYQPVCDPRSKIITDLLATDNRFAPNRNRALHDWIADDLANGLAKATTNNLSFDSGATGQMIHRYIEQVARTSNDLTPRMLRDIATTIAPESSLVPHHYASDDAFRRPITDFKNRLIPHQLDLRSLGRIPIEDLDRIDYNPRAFQKVCDILDCIPLTDFNVDLIVHTDFAIAFYHENIALNRLGQFDDNDLGLYNPQSILEDCFSETFLKEMLHTFIRNHNYMTQEIEEIIRSYPVKVKVIKTITDEAAVLLYRHDSTSDDAPLCGVYFDIALQSLAPMTIVPELCLY